MTIKECTLEVMEEWCTEDKPIRQVDIYTEVSKITGKNKESVRCNSFRNPLSIPELWRKYTAVKHNGYISYIKKPSKYKQRYNKPKQYFKLLEHLNKYNKIYTLAGTESHCMKVLNVKRTLTVDYSPHSKADIKGNIYDILDGEAYNFDTEGRVTMKKINYMNELYERGCKAILFTFRHTKGDIYLRRVKGFKLTEKCNYNSNGAKMGIHLYTV